MKKILFSLFLIGIIFNSQAQIGAITENGDEVLLNEDGTWVYKSKDAAPIVAIKKNEVPVIKNANATFMVKSKRTKMGVWINPKKWAFSKSASNESAEFEFQAKDQDLYAMLIAEKTIIPVETLAEIALENAKESAPDAKIVTKEYVTVNGKEMIRMELKGSIRGVKFVYLGFYYSNFSGSFQLVTYTSDNLIEEYRADMNTFLSGLAEQ